MPAYLNIACGKTFIRDPAWENIDYVSLDKAVRVSNILGNLTTLEDTYEALYCSHFVEHIPPDSVVPFLKRCRGFLKSGGIFRIVVPDSEMLLREYLKYKDEGNHLYSQYAYINFLDQCVRLRSGGMLQDCYSKIASHEAEELREYAIYLNGNDVFSASDRLTSSSFIAPEVLQAFWRPNRVWRKLEPAYIRIVCALLPKAFRRQNVSFAGVGERHLWMYDFESLKSVLSSAGYSRVQRFTFNTSTRSDDLFRPLDEIDGKPRKGNHQLFVEAQE
jgi:predicted SAM-dependent methyltransferase